MLRLQVLGLELVYVGGLEAAVEVPLEAGEGGMRAIRNLASIQPCAASAANPDNRRIALPSSHSETSFQSVVVSDTDTPLIP